MGLVLSNYKKFAFGILIALSFFVITTLFSGNAVLAQQNQDTFECQILSEQSTWPVHLIDDAPTVNWDFTLPVGTQSVMISGDWQWTGVPFQFQANEIHDVITPVGTISCPDFGNEELAGQWHYCGSVSGNYASNLLTITFQFTGDDSASGSHNARAQVVACANAIPTITPTETPTATPTPTPTVQDPTPTNTPTPTLEPTLTNDQNGEVEGATNTITPTPTEDSGEGDVLSATELPETGFGDIALFIAALLLSFGLVLNILLSPYERS